MNKLKVVDFMGMRLVSLPSSIGLLTNFQTLCLQRCRLDDVAMVGELKQLESLSFANSETDELPREIDALTRLKLLDLRNCTNLKVIPDNVFSKLCSLEELYMLNSFVGWNVKGHANLVELDSLSHLSMLEIQIVNSNLIKQTCNFFDGLKSYKISIGDDWGYWPGGNDERSRALKLKLDAGIPLNDGIQVLLGDAEDLYLSETRGIESVLYDLDRKGFPQLKHLHIQNDYGIQHLIKSKMRASCHAVPMLESSLNLNNLMSLEKICFGQLEMVSFGELRILRISCCDKLKRVFSLSSAKGLLQLREMEIDSCGNMETIVGQESEDEQYDNEVIEFNQLSSLKLNKLPHLKLFCKMNEGFAQGELLFNEMISFPNLTSLEVYNCNSLKYVFTVSMLKSLVQLKNLHISDCELLEEIIQSKKDDEIEEENINAIVFPKLDQLSLIELGNVKTFSWGYSIEFPLLRELRMGNCSAMKNFVSRSLSNEREEYLFNEMVTFSNLETIEVYSMNFKYLWDAQLIRANNDSFSTNLKFLSIRKCSKLSVVFPFNACRRLQRLKTLNIHDCVGVEEIYQYQGIDFKEINIVEAFSLQDLQIKNLHSLKNIWSHDLYGAFTFGNLQSVDVCGCPDLKFVFPASIACGLLNLQQLRIGSCYNLEAIISRSKDEGSDPSFRFPELTVLELTYLMEMRSLYEGRHTFECPKLKSLEVLRVSYIFVEKCISNLEELRIDYQSLNAIQQSGEFPVELYSKPRKVTLENLKEESSILVVSGFLRRLKSLERLVFDGCSLEEIFFGLDNQRPIGQKQLHRLITPKHLEFRYGWGLKHIIRKKEYFYHHIL